MREPGPDHPITIAPYAGRVVVRFAGQVLVDTTDAPELKEASYPAVPYLPRGDADMAALRPSAKRSTCPYKGEASYFSLETEDAAAPDAVWSYEEPHPAVQDIAGRLAFYPDRVAIETTSA